MYICIVTKKKFTIVLMIIRNRQIMRCYHMHTCKSMLSHAHVQDVLHTCTTSHTRAWRPTRGQDDPYTCKTFHTRARPLKRVQDVPHKGKTSHTMARRPIHTAKTSHTGARRPTHGQDVPHTGKMSYTGALRPTHVHDVPHACNTSHSCARRPTHVQYVSKLTVQDVLHTCNTSHNCARRPTHVQYDSQLCKTSHTRGRRPTYVQRKKKRKRKIIIEIWNKFITRCTYLKLKLSKCLYLLRYNSDTLCRKGEYVYKTKFTYTIESNLIIPCRHTLISIFISRYSIDDKTKNIEIAD